MAEGNIYPSSPLAGWLREFNSRQKWVQELGGIHAAQVADLSGWTPQYKNAATEAIGRAARPYFQQFDWLATDLLSPYREVLRAALPSVTVTWDVTDRIVQNLTVAIESKHLSHDLIEEVHKDYEELYPHLAPSVGQWPSWVEELVWQIFIVFLTFAIWHVVLGVITEHQAWAWVADLMTYVGHPDPLKGVRGTWHSRPGTDRGTNDLDQNQ